MTELTVLPLEQFGLLSVVDAAERRGVDDETVRSWLRKGLPVVVAGSGRNRTVHLIPIAALDAFAPAPVGAPKKTATAKPMKTSTPKKSRKKSRNH